MKKSVFFVFQILILVFVLCSCSTPEAYIPTGEIYVKTSPACGDAGAGTVIDMEIEKNEYTNSDSTLIPVTIGFGHLVNVQPNVEMIVKLIVEVYEYSPTNKNSFFKKEIIIEDYYSDTYSTTKPKDRQFLFILSYGNFYPYYHENIEVKIPNCISHGYIRASLEESDGNDNIYSSFYLDLDFNQTNNQIIFVIKNDRLRQ